MGMLFCCYNGGFRAASFVRSPSLSHATVTVPVTRILYFSVLSLLSQQFPLFLFSEPVGDCGLPVAPEASAGAEGGEVQSPVPHGTGLEGRAAETAGPAPHH